jgi:actin
MTDKDSPAVVIEHNSIVKAGFYGDDAPRSVFEGVVGRIKSKIYSSQYPRNYFVGDEALSKRGILLLRNTIQGGYINKQLNKLEVENWTCWTDIEVLYRHIFENELCCDSYPSTLLSHNVGTDHNDFEKLAQLLFEEFSVPSLCFTNPSRMSLYAMGRATGTVVNCGKQSTIISSFIEGRALPEIVRTTSGDDISKRLREIMFERGHTFGNPSERTVIEDMKENLCRASLDFEKDVQGNEQFEPSYELPNGDSITIGNNKYRAVEIFFTPQNENVSLQHGVIKVLNQFSGQQRNQMLDKIVLTGNGACLENVDNRLKIELDKLTGENTSVTFAGKYASWLGAAKFAEKTDEWILKSDYEEYGPLIVQKYLKKSELRCTNDTLLNAQDKKEYIDLDLVYEN